jgi:excisionase family DNA binding protein
MPHPRLLTVKEAAELLRQDEYTVRRLLREGKLPGRQRVKGAAWRIDADELEQHLALDAYLVERQAEVESHQQRMRDFDARGGIRATYSGEEFRERVESSSILGPESKQALREAQDRVNLADQLNELVPPDVLDAFAEIDSKQEENAAIEQAARDLARRLRILRRAQEILEEDE